MLLNLNNTKMNLEVDLTCRMRNRIVGRVLLSSSIRMQPRLTRIVLRSELRQRSCKIYMRSGSNMLLPGRVKPARCPFSRFSWTIDYLMYDVIMGAPFIYMVIFGNGSNKFCELGSTV